ncbi:hypothetical protein LY28_03378 [Ruminiclostridium sufflavum DSM 19573]|uniref:Uncharacterized protein n=1 Tax=Ruminiclostridium sufflavum DSM 19573 TaxID=1121337 RepID=A0A318Y208_9FIRM|nr:hypothetical protein [Ruminiclostridium sufflavum]PYG85018.1 hypothetical protein LY28_03378 [Ruminiclostridium sufflavum DSM 19573]
MAINLANFFTPILFMLVINVVFGIIAVSMAKRRGLNTVPAFFAGFFGSFVPLLIIAMFPVNKQY